jgi:O-antigen/teichoic acid export membrane protein
MKNEVIKVTTNTSAQLIGKAASAITTFITIAAINRNFGGELLGDFYLMTGFASYFYLLTDFGINAVATREISKEVNWLTDTQKVKKLFNNLLTIRVLGSALLVVILVAALPFIPFRLRNLELIRVGIAVGLLTIISQAIYNCATVVFQSSLSYQKLVLASVIGNVSFLLLVFLFLFKGYGVLSLVTANTLGMLIVSGLSFFLAYKAMGAFRFEFDLVLWRNLIVSSLPLGIGILLTVVVAKADQFLLSVMALSPRLNLTNDLALGNYGTAYKIFENILVFPTYFVNAVFPILVKNLEHNPAKHQRVFWMSFYFMLGFSFLITLSGWILAPLAIGLIGGTSLALSTEALRILLLSLPLFFTSALFLFLMIAQNQQKKIPFIYLAAAIFNVTLNLIFIPNHGFIASAWITGLTELLILLFVGYFGLRGLKSASVL